MDFQKAVAMAFDWDDKLAVMKVDTTVELMVLIVVGTLVAQMAALMVEGLVDYLGCAKVAMMAVELVEL